LIVIRIELWPHGSFAQRKLIALGKIVNTGGTDARGEYAVTLYGSGNGETRDIEYVYERLILDELRQRVPWRTGVVTNFPRKREGAWSLLLVALMDAVAGLRRLV
jgi:hypothetical protein